MIDHNLTNFCQVMVYFYIVKPHTIKSVDEVVTSFTQLTYFSALYLLFGLFIFK